MSALLPLLLAHVAGEHLVEVVLLPLSKAMHEAVVRGSAAVQKVQQTLDSRCFTGAVGSLGIVGLVHEFGAVVKRD